MTPKIILTLKDMLIMNGKISLLLYLESEFDFGPSVVHPYIFLLLLINHPFVTFLLIIKLTVVATEFLMIESHLKQISCNLAVRLRSWWYFFLKGIFFFNPKKRLLTITGEA